MRLHSLSDLRGYVRVHHEEATIDPVNINSTKIISISDSPFEVYEPNQISSRHQRAEEATWLMNNHRIDQLHHSDIDFGTLRNSQERRRKVSALTWVDRACARISKCFSFLWELSERRVKRETESREREGERDSERERVRVRERERGGKETSGETIDETQGQFDELLHLYHSCTPLIKSPRPIREEISEQSCERWSQVDLIGQWRVLEVKAHNKGLDHSCGQKDRERVWEKIVT
jgi:hypothetical protein